MSSMTGVARQIPQRIPVSQGWLFQRLRGRIVRNAGRLMFANSRVKIISMVSCSAVIWLALYAGAIWGFGLISHSPMTPVGGIMELLLGTMFLTLGGMLIVSTGLILYASLFTGAEAKFLLTTPARADQIFAMKFQSAIVFSSWAFVVLGGPILIAYGVTFSVPWYFYALLPVYLASYVILPGALGAILCLMIVNYFPQRRAQALAGLLALVALVLVYWAWQVIAVTKQGFGNRDSLQRIFDMFELAKSNYSPSKWMSHGLLALARGDVASSLFPLALLWSNALLLYLVAAFLAKRTYRRGVNRISEGFNAFRIYGASRLDRFMSLLVCYLDPKTRLLIVKDFRTFRREPAQVGQLALFAGLMLLCVANMRQFLGADLPVINQYFISLLNWCATGLLMCAYLGRFVYPLISLEGRKFWILGLLPLKREQLLWGKFAFAVTMTMVLAGGIILVSDLVLDMPLSAIVIHMLALGVLSFGLSGMGVGMSAWIPNFRETDPSKIVVGFGGTMFTIASLMYLVLTVALMCLPYHIASARDSFQQTARNLPWWVYAGIPAGLIMAVLCVWLPMRVGSRTLQKMEF